MLRQFWWQYDPWASHLVGNLVKIWARFCVHLSRDHHPNSTAMFQSDPTIANGVLFVSHLLFRREHYSSLCLVLPTHHALSVGGLGALLAHSNSLTLTLRSCLFCVNSEQEDNYYDGEWILICLKRTILLVHSIQDFMACSHLLFLLCHLLSAPHPAEPTPR